MIVYKKRILVIAIILCSLFTFSDYKSMEQIHLLSNKIAELSKSNEKLNSEIADLTKINKELLNEGNDLFDWNVDSTDAAVLTQAKEIIINEVLIGSHNKKQAIILMHDSKPKITTAQALPDIIKGLKGQGFKFSVLTPKVNGVQFK